MNDLRNIMIFSNLIINKYVIKIDETDKIKDNLQSYHGEHTKKVNQFRIDVIWRKTM